MYRASLVTICCCVALVDRGRAQADTVRHAAGSSTIAWQLADADFLAEDVAYDATRRAFLVSSVRRGGVHAIDEHGTVTRLIPPDTATWGTFAIGIDSRRNTLWVTTAAFPGTANYTATDSAHSMLLEYELSTGRMRRRLSPPDGGPHALGDLTIAPDGTLYLSDGFGGAVYVVDPDASAMRPLVAPRTFRSPQTPALAADGRRLYVPDYSVGIAVINVSDGSWHWLPHADSLNLKGIDGLYRVGSELLAVQNGWSPNRILRLGLGSGDRIERAGILVGDAAANDLNHALPMDGLLYFISRSGWDRMAADGRFTPGTAGEAPQLRKVPL